MMALVSIIFILTLLASVFGYIKTKQVITLIVFLIVGPLLISIVLNVGSTTMLNLPPMVKIVTIIILFGLILKLVLPGNTGLVIMKSILWLPFQLIAALLQAILEFFTNRTGINKKSVKRSKINY